MGNTFKVLDDIPDGDGEDDEDAEVVLNPCVAYLEVPN